MKRSAVLTFVAFALLAVTTTPGQASCGYACNLTTCANCGSGWECAEGCAGSSCTGFHEYCSCVGYCQAQHTNTHCECRVLEPSSGKAGTFEAALDGFFSWGFYSGDGSSLSLDHFGAALEFASGWGVVLAGNTSVTVTGGNWSGTLQEVVNSIGSQSGFSASFDSSAHIITLTGL